MMKRFFNGSSPTIASAAVIVAGFSVVSRIAGFVRDRILLGLFGTGETLDAYYQAFRLPDFLLQLLVVGALSASFIPIFTKHFSAGNHDRAWRYTNAMLLFLLLSFGVLALVGAVFAPLMAPLIAPGFDAATQAMMASMMRVMFLGQCFFSISLVFGSVLQGAKRFVLYSLAPIVNNVGIIAGAIFFVPLIGAVGLAWGAVLGAVLHALVQVVGVAALGYTPALVRFWREADIRRTVLQMGPRVMGLAVNQVNFLIMGIIASTLAVGSMTVLNLAYTLNFFPIGVIAVSYAIAAFPTFCERAGRDAAGFSAAFSDTIRQVLFYIIPATVLFLLLRAQLVRILFGADQFDWQATIITADTLGFFALSFFAQSIVFVVVRAYFAHEDTVTPLVIGVLCALLNAAASWVLAEQMGVAGLGLAFSLTAIFQAALLWVMLRVRVGSLGEAAIVRSLAVLSVAGLGAGVAVQAVKYAVVQFWELDTFWHVFSQAAAASLAGIAVYGVVAFALGSKEMVTVAHGLRRKLLTSARTSEVTESV